MAAARQQLPPSHGADSENAQPPARHVGGWLRRREARALDEAALVSSLGRQLQRAGLGFDRLAFHVGTLHPEIFARIVAWSPGEPVEVYERDHPATLAAGFPGSPFREAASLRQKLVVRAPSSDFLGRAAGALLHDRGVSELVAAPFVDRDGRAVIVSLCTAWPSTFSATDHLMMDGAIALLQDIGHRSPWTKRALREP